MEGRVRPRLERETTAARPATTASGATMYLKDLEATRMAGDGSTWL